MAALVTRRSMLVAGLALGGAATVGAGLTLPRPAPGYRVLGAGELQIVEAIARVMFPAGHFPVYGGDGGTAPMVDEFLAVYTDPSAVTPFRFLLRSIQIGTLLSRGRPFTTLPVADAKEVLEVWASEDPFPRRLASDSFKVMLGAGFFRRPEVVAAIGWQAGCQRPPREPGGSP